MYSIIVTCLESQNRFQCISEVGEESDWLDSGEKMTPEKISTPASGQRENETLSNKISTPASGEINTKECRYYLRGVCRHGYSGNLEVNGKEKCEFFHPPLCKVFLANGDGERGCKDDCNLKHPTLLMRLLKS